LVVSFNGINVNRSRLLISDLEKELFKRGIGPAIDGQNIIANPKPCGLGTLEEVGGNIRTRLIHGAPPEIRAIAPLNDIHSVKNKYCQGEQKNRQKTGPGMF